MIDATRTESDDTLQAFAPGLMAYLATYDEAVPENILFRQKVLAAVRAVQAEGPAEKVADEALARLSDIPDTHPGADKARSLFIAALLQTGSSFHSRQLDKITAVRKAASAVVAHVAGIKLGDLTLALKDETWLRFPTSLSRKMDWATATYWSCCSALAGVQQARKTLNDEDNLTYYDPGLYDGPDRTFSYMQYVLDVEFECDLNNLADYAVLLAGLIDKLDGFHALTGALLAERSLIAWDVERVLTEHDVFPASLRFHDFMCPRLEVGLENAPYLSAKDLSTVVYISQARLKDADGPTLTLGRPVHC